jgi:hypothetical protein
VDVKPFLIAAAASFGLVIVESITGAVLRSRFKITTEHIGPTWTLAIKVLNLLIFAVIGFSLVPVALRLFLSMQAGAGNGDLVVIRWLAANEPGVVYSIWGLFAAGLAIAFPAALKGGLFK